MRIFDADVAQARQARSDIQYLLAASRLPFEEIPRAVERLPPPFAADPLIRDNLDNLKADMALWGLI